MSDLPPLPDTNDPHELLGVSESADELTIKRAYLRLIRTYRPERAPEAFQRLHQAYERALEYLSWTRWIEPESEEAPEDRSSADSDDDALHATLRAAWRALAAGEAGEAWRRADDAVRDRPNCAVTAAHRALLVEALGEPAHRAAAPLVASLGSSASLAPWLTSLFQPGDLGQALANDMGRWTRLRAHSQRPAAARLLRRRWHRCLLEGALDQTIDEVFEPAFVDDAHDDPWLLADVAQEVGLAAVWRRPKDAERIFAEHGHGAHPGDGGFTIEDQYHLIRLEEQDQRFRAAFDAHDLPVLLERWFTLWPILDVEEQRRLARRLTEDLERDPGPYLAAFDRMGEVAPGLIGRHAESVEHAGAPTDADVPLLQRERVRKELDQLADTLPRGGIGKSRRHYAERMRPVFLDAVVRHALSPRHIVWWLSKVANRLRETRGSARMAYHRIHLLEDVGIAGVYWTCRLRELPEVPEDRA